MLAATGCAGSSNEGDASPVEAGRKATPGGFRNADLGNGWHPGSSLEVGHARNFSIDYFEGEGGANAVDPYALICVGDGTRFLVVPEGRDEPDGLADDIQSIRRPPRNVYLVASNVLCLIDALGEVGSVALVGVKPENCTVASFSEAIEAGEIAYGGKYNAPDYELVADARCPLAIENTMVNHDPDVKRKLRELGMAVLVDQSSNEPSALGRLEWIKLYGELWGKADVASALFDEQVAQVDAVAEKIAAESATDGGDGNKAAKTVAFFYINANGAAVTRRRGDFVAQMIEMAGGVYLLDDSVGDDAPTSTVTLEMERFYALAKDADVVIYNATVDDAVRDLDDLLAKNSLLGDFKAVGTGDVWCTERNLYQRMTETGQIVSDIHAALTDPDVDALDFMFRLV